MSIRRARLIILMTLFVIAITVAVWLRPKPVESAWGSAKHLVTAPPADPVIRDVDPTHAKLVTPIQVRVGSELSDYLRVTPQTPISDLNLNAEGVGRGANEFEAKRVQERNAAHIKALEASLVSWAIDVDRSHFPKFDFEHRTYSFVIPGFWIPNSTFTTKPHARQMFGQELTSEQQIEFQGWRADDRSIGPVPMIIDVPFRNAAAAEAFLTSPASGHHSRSSRKTRRSHG